MVYTTQKYQQPKIVGQPCSDCGTPYIQGQKGPYCKICYIAWKNTQQTPQTTPQVACKDPQSTPQPDDKPDWETINKKKDQNMAELNAKKGAADIIAAMINTAFLSPNDWEQKFKEVANKIYNHNCS